MALTVCMSTTTSCILLERGSLVHLPAVTWCLYGMRQLSISSYITIIMSLYCRYDAVNGIPAAQKSVAFEKVQFVCCAGASDKRAWQKCRLPHANTFITRNLVVCDFSPYLLKLNRAQNTYF